MGTLKENNVKLAKEYIHTFVYNQDFSIVNDLFEENCAIYNNFGFSLGPGIYVKKSEFWYSFKPIQLKIFSEIAANHCVAYHYNIILKHIMPYSGIEPTGNECNLDVMLNVKSANNKINKAFISSNIEDTIKNLVGADQKRFSDSIKKPLFPNVLEDLLNTTCQHIQSKNIRISVKGLICLSLWFVGKSDSEIGRILNLSRRTVNYYQDRLKSIFNCYSKNQLFEKVKHLKLAHLLNECFILIMTHKLQQHDEVLLPKSSA